MSSTEKIGASASGTLKKGGPQQGEEVIPGRRQSKEGFSLRRSKKKSLKDYRIHRNKRKTKNQVKQLSMGKGGPSARKRKVG